MPDFDNSSATHRHPNVETGRKSERDSRKLWPVWVLVSLVSVAGCAQPEQTAYQRPATLLSFSEAPEIPVRVGKIEIALANRNYVDMSSDDFLVSPEDVARLWPTERLRKTGGPDTLRYLIDLVEARSTRTGEGEIIDAALEIQLTIETEEGRQTAGAGARINSRTRITGVPTEAEREQILYRMSRDIAAKLDKKLEESFRGVLVAYVGPETQGNEKPVETAKGTARKTRALSQTQPRLTAQAKPKPSPPARTTQKSTPSTKPATSAGAAKPKPKQPVRQPSRQRKPLPANAWKTGWDWD